LEKISGSAYIGSGHISGLDKLYMVYALDTCGEEVSQKQLPVLTKINVIEVLL